MADGEHFAETRRIGDSGLHWSRKKHGEEVETWRTHHGRSQRRRADGGGAWLGGADSDELGLRFGGYELRTRRGGFGDLMGGDTVWPTI